MVRKFAIQVPFAAIGTFCNRWRVTEFSLFGSVLEGGLGVESDVDVLVTFSPEAEWDLFDATRMEEELQVIFGRRVDLVTRRALEDSPNWIRREAILGSAVPIYVA